MPRSLVALDAEMDKLSRERRRVRQMYRHLLDQTYSVGRSESMGGNSAVWQANPTQALAIDRRREKLRAGLRSAFDHVQDATSALRAAETAMRRVTGQGEPVRVEQKPVDKAKYQHQLAAQARRHDRGEE